MATTKTNESPKARQWQSVISQWEHSGLSQREFCRRREVSLSALRYWRHRLSEALRERDANFIQVAKTGAVNLESGARMKIHVGGHVVETDGCMDPRRLGAILRTIRDL